MRNALRYASGLVAVSAIAAITVPVVARTQTPAPQARATLALVGGTLIDGHGGPILTNSVVLVDGQRITAIGQVGRLAVPPGTRVVSTEGMFVLPGLWDMHVHLMLAGHGNYAHWDLKYPPLLEPQIIPATARQTLLAGVTSVRDLGSPLEPMLRVRERITRGEIPGPTIYMSGPFIQHTPYPGTEAFRWGVNGAEDARTKVRRLAEAKVDVIKLIDQDEMTMEEIRAVVDEAHKHRLPVIAHSHRPEEIRRGLAAGVDGFEHTGLATAWEYPADIVDGLRARAAQGNKPPLFWTPTIDVLTNFDARRDDLEFLDDPAWRLGLADSVARDIRGSLARLDTLTYYRFVPNRKPTLANKFRQLRESGVRLLIGTDAGVPASFHGPATISEMITWVRAYGMDPMDVIRAATFWPAVAMNVERENGSVAVGKYADIIAVRGNPLRDMGVLRNVDVVVKRGQVVK
ncbi:MAG: amidohydrolase family protein [Gemmatimonadota bacterium]|nr:amidohydrolase family protein [Gemmatimonadota bacterium]